MSIHDDSWLEIAAQRLTPSHPPKPQSTLVPMSKVTPPSAFFSPQLSPPPPLTNTQLNLFPAISRSTQSKHLKQANL